MNDYTKSPADDPRPSLDDHEHHSAERLVRSLEEEQDALLRLIVVTCLEHLTGPDTSTNATIDGNWLRSAEASGPEF